MSGQATGWVLRHGPKDRAMRLVLLTVADAANRDGEHAHPGLAAIVEGSLYGRAHVLATLARLVADGWLEIEAEGGGRGRATVYRIPGVLGKVQPVDPSRKGPLEGKGPIPEAKGSNPDPETVQSEPSTPMSTTVSPTVDTNARQTATADAESFEEFWRRYPPRRGLRKGKRQALDQWRRMSATKRLSALGAVRNFAAHCEESGEYPPDAHRWLRDDLWDDWHRPLPVRIHNGSNGSNGRGPTTADFLAIAAMEDQ